MKISRTIGQILMGLHIYTVPLMRGCLETASPSLNLMLLLLTAYRDFAFWSWEASQQLMA